MPSRRPMWGQALVEFAIALPLFLLLLAGLIEGARLVFSFTELSYAVADGARRGSISSTVAVPTVQAAVTQSNRLAQNLPNLPPLSVAPSDVTVTVTRPSVGGTTVDFASRQTGDYVQVTANYTYRSLFSLMLPFNPTIPISRQAVAIAE